MSEGIPEEWEIVNLNDNLSLMTDYVANGSFESLRKNVSVYDSKNYAFYIRLYDIRKGVGHAEQKYVDESSYEFLSKSSLKCGDILIANIGANVGEVFQLPAISMKATLAPNMIMMRVNSTTESSFLYYYLSSDDGKKNIATAISGSGQPKVNKTDLKRINSILPPLPEQNKIASILTSVDGVIEKTEAQISKLQDLKKGMMQELLTKGIGHTEFKDSPVGRIPVEWELHPLGQLFSIQLGKMLNKTAKEGKSPFPYLANRNVQWGRVVLTSLPEMDFDDRERKKFRLKKGDLLVCEGGEVGRTAIWNDEIANCYYQKAVHRLRPTNNQCLPTYYLYVMEFIVKSNLLQNFVSQTSIAHLTKENLEDIPVPLPPKAEQEEIASAIFSVEAQLRNHEKKHSHLVNLKKSLMQDLLTGKVRVKVN